jgi:hypothetical protein
LKLEAVFMHYFLLSRLLVEVFKDGCPVSLLGALSRAGPT